MPAAASAAVPQATPQIHALAGQHADQVVMLSNWPAESRIERLETDSGDLGFTTVTLAASPDCDQRALPLSNHALPPQRWVAKAATDQGVARIAARLGPARSLQVIRIQSDTHGVPEFRLPSSDGLDAWLIRMVPALDRELALRSRPAAKPGTESG